MHARGCLPRDGSFLVEELILALNRLRPAFGDRLVNELAARLVSGTSPEIDPRELTDAMGGSHTVGQVTELLEAAAAEKLVTPVDVVRCPAGRHVLDESEVRDRACHQCPADFRESGEEPVAGRVYRIEGELGSVIDWVIAIHGFNTRGPWQEEFSWRIANVLKYSAPILIYKYGLIQLGVLFGPRHRTLARQLGNRIRAAIELARAHGRGEVPNLVIHSFGSKLFVTLLELPEFDDLKFGRVIAAGSIIRPDYDWSKRLAEGRLDAILNHCGGSDRAVPFAYFTIPGAGPGGTVGFSDPHPQVINIRDPEYGHSSCFTPEAIAANLGDKGAWDSFLRGPLDKFSDDRRFAAATVKWKRRPLLRVAARGIVMVLLAAAALAILFLIVASALGAAHLLWWR